MSSLDSGCKSKSLVGHTIRYNWIRIALIEKTVLDIVTSLLKHCKKLYHKESLIANPVTGTIFLELLSGLVALDYTKTKTPDHFWSDPPAEELMQRQKARGDQPRNSKNNSSLHMCSPNTFNYVTDNDPSSYHTRNLVESLYQSNHSVLLFGKNNVTVQKPEGDYQTGYLALHHADQTFHIKWMSNRFVDQHSDPSFYWDYSWIVYLDDVAYIHAHPYEKDGTVVFIGHDGVQRPPVLFPSQSSLLDFLTCLETGLHSERFSMEPKVASYLTPNGSFPPKAEKKKAPKQPSFFVFQIMTNSALELDEANGKRKRESLGSMLSINSDFQIKAGKKTKDDSASESEASVSSELSSKAITENESYGFHLPTRIGEVCQTMRYQILSRAFYGWLAYCRHLTTVRKHLSGMVYPARRNVTYPHLESGVTSELWASLHNTTIVTDKEQVMYYTYFGGVDPTIRPEVWKYLLQHYQFTDTQTVRTQTDIDTHNYYQGQVSAWERVELYIMTNNRSKFAPVLDHSDKISVSEVPVLEEDKVINDEVTDEVGDEVTDEVTDEVVKENGEIHDHEVIVIGGVEYKDEFLVAIDLNFHRIDKDVQRCDRNYPYYVIDSNLSKLRRIMCTYVWENLEIGYLQGMCDLLAPILVVIDDEAIAYSCFKNFMSRMTMNFPHGGLMDNHFANMRSLIQILDGELFDHMHQNGDYTHFYFSYRWFLLDFKRELEYEDVFRVWEVTWAAFHCTSNHFTHFIALALVEHYRDIILDNNMDFTDIIKFFNEMAEKHDGRKILNSARQLVYRLQKLIDS